MKKIACAFALSLCVSCLMWADQTRQQVDQRLKDSAEVLHQIMATPDKGIPEEVLKSAKCVAVVPSLVKAGFVLGAEHGRGVATCRLANGAWSAPAFLSVSGGSFGAQIGAEGIDLVMLIMNEQGMKTLLSNKFSIGGDVSAAAGPVGRHAAAGTDWKLDTQVLTYSRAKGAFAGISLDGAKIATDDDSMAAIYSPGATMQAALTGKLKTPPEAQAFLTTVSGAQAEAKKS